MVPAEEQARCWILTDGKAGTESQCIGLAEALGLAAARKISRPRAPWKWLPAACWPWPLRAQQPGADSLAPPWPALLIAAGRAAVAPAAAIRRAAAGATRVVALLDPRIDPRRFDLVIAPAHDGLTGENVLVTEGALNRVTPERLAEAALRWRPALDGLPRPLAAVLIGGSNPRYGLTPAIAEELGRRLAALAAAGVGLALTASRRTGAEAEAALRRGLGDASHYFWDGRGDNPYFGLLALADHILVTEDSVSMTSEAASTGKPVHVIGLRADDPGKFARFHQRLRDAGITRAFDGTLPSWDYPPLAETARAAAAVRRLLA